MKCKKQFYGLIKPFIVIILLLNTAYATDLPDPDIFDGALNTHQVSQNKTESNNNKKQPTDASSSSKAKDQNKTEADQKGDQNTSASEASTAKENKEHSTASKNIPQEAPAETDTAQTTTEPSTQGSSSTTVAEKSTPNRSAPEQPISVTIGDNTQTIKVDIPEDMLPEPEAEKPNPVYSGDVKVTEKKDRPTVKVPPSTNRTRTGGIDSGETLPTEL